ncbi:MAG: glycosyl transferase [Pseudonocardiales bacterium]|nr:MAG: glycosyl transferase [Pseudonocardiales bacterium]
MKIGVIASVAHRLPPRDDSARGRIVSSLVDGFVARGHEVTLFASADSQTSAWLHGTAAVGYADDKRVDARVCEAVHHAAAFERASGFDVLVNQSDFVPLSYSRLVSTPMVTTLHGISSPQELLVYRGYDDIAHYVAISDADRLPDLHYDATIHYGVDPARFTFEPDAGAYLLFLDRIHPDTGAHLAIEVARRARLPLIIAGAIQDKAYFRDAVQPHVDGADVSCPGPVDHLQRDALLGGARALLHLISFAEPFGLPVIEALATGTPVIATPLGSMPELLRHGSTGLLVSDASAAVAAVAQVGDLDRRVCRDEAVSRFGADRMVESYLALFERILGAKTPRHPGSIQSIGSPGLFSHATT